MLGVAGLNFFHLLRTPSYTIPTSFLLRCQEMRSYIFLWNANFRHLMLTVGMWFVSAAAQLSTISNPWLPFQVPGFEDKNKLFNEDHIFYQIVHRFKICPLSQLLGSLVAAAKTRAFTANQEFCIQRDARREPGNADVWPCAWAYRWRWLQSNWRHWNWLQVPYWVKYSVAFVLCGYSWCWRFMSTLWNVVHFGAFNNPCTLVNNWLDGTTLGFLQSPRLSCAHHFVPWQGHGSDRQSSLQSCV